MNTHEYPHQTPLNPLIVICGPTATGKTDYALKLAKEKNGEIVSADSRQVYKYLDIGTGKDISKKSKFEIRNSKFEIKNNRVAIGYYVENGVPLWLYDVITLDRRFSAYEYAVIARKVINNIWIRGKTPILVGGTGLYINAVVDGLDVSAPPNWKLRGAIEKLGVEELQNKLQAINPERFNTMNNSDKNNPRRLVRAIEIEESCKSLNAQRQPENKLQGNKTGQGKLLSINTMVNFIGLKYDRDVLYSRINKRVDKRLQQGMLEEIKSVLKKGYSWNDPGMNTLGYKQLRAYFEKEETLEETVQKWKYAEHDYARRQVTWFNKDKRIQWITI